MKKWLAFILAMIFVLNLAACGSGETKDTAPESDTTTETDTTSDVDTSSADSEDADQETETEIQSYQLGDTVSTDIFELTLDTAAFAIALDNGKKDLDGNIKDTYMMPKEYNAETDKDNPFVAPKGHTFVSITYTINNLDRAFANFNDQEDQLFTIEYQGTTYTPEIVDGLYRIYAERSMMDDSGAIEKIAPDQWQEFENNYYGVGLQVGEKETRRFYMDIPVDAENLTDDFSVIVQIPTSDGTTTEFTYLVTQ